MKKFLSILFLGILLPGFGQCTIDGVTSATVGEEVTLTVSGAEAQCKECHLWVAVGNTAVISGDARLKTVKIASIKPGRQVISLAMLTPQGLAQCSKNIDVLEQTAGVANSSAPLSTTNVPPPAPPVAKPCDINVNNYKEVKYEAGVVSFFPLDTQGDWKYKWTVTYNDGETSKSYEKVPQFNYSAAKPINTVKLQVVSQKCMKEFTKRYDSNFWLYF